MHDLIEEHIRTAGDSRETNQRHHILRSKVYTMTSETRFAHQQLKKQPFYSKMGSRTVIAPQFLGNFADGRLQSEEKRKQPQKLVYSVEHR